MSSQYCRVLYSHPRCILNKNYKKRIDIGRLSMSNEVPLKYKMLYYDLTQYYSHNDESITYKVVVMFRFFIRFSDFVIKHRSTHRGFVMGHIPSIILLKKNYMKDIHIYDASMTNKYPCRLKMVYEFTLNFQLYKPTIQKVVAAFRFFIRFLNLVIKHRSKGFFNKLEFIFRYIKHRL